MTPEIDPGFWKSVAGLMWMPLTGLVVLVWTNLTGRVKHIEEQHEKSADRLVSKDELNRVRDAIADLYAKTDANKELVNQKIGDAQRYVSQDVARLRDDMNGGFERIYKTIMEQSKG